MLVVFAHIAEKPSANRVQAAIPSRFDGTNLISFKLRSPASMPTSSSPPPSYIHFCLFPIHLFTCPLPLICDFFSDSENFLSPFLSLTIKYSWLFYFAPLSLTFSHHIEEKQKKMIQLSVWTCSCVRAYFFISFSLSKILRDWSRPESSPQRYTRLKSSQHGSLFFLS